VAFHRLHPTYCSPPAFNLRGVQLLPRRLLLAWGVGIGLLAIAVLLVASVGLANSFQAQRIAEFRRTHQALQLHFAQSQAQYANVANTAQYAWKHPHPGDTAMRALRERFEQSGQRVVLTTEEDKSPQMILGVQTEQWSAQRVERYFQLSQALSLAQPGEAAPGPASGAVAYFFDPSGHYLSLGKGMTEAQLTTSLGVGNRPDLFRELRTRAQLISPTSVMDSVPMLEGVGRQHYVQWALGAHPVTDLPQLVASFYAYDGEEPIATFVAYQAVEPLLELMRVSSQGRLALLDDSGVQVSATYSTLTESERLARLRAGNWTSLGDAIRPRFDDGYYLLALPVPGTPWTLVESYGWQVLAGYVTRNLQAPLLGVLVMLGLMAWFLKHRYQQLFVRCIQPLTELYESERQLRCLVDHLPYGIALLDSNGGQAQAINPSALRMCERAGHTLLSQLPACTVGSEGLLTAPSAGEHARTYQVHATALDLEPGTMRMVVLADVQDWVERVQARQAALDAACARARAKAAFVASISHEIRTPMHAIIGHLELLARGELASAERRRVRRIRQATDSLMLVIDNALDLSRAEFGQLDAPVHTFNPVALLERVTRLFLPLAAAKEIALNWSIGDGVPLACRAREDFLERILRNLVGNAIKFTSSGQIQVVLTQRVQDNQMLLCLEVIDSGIGMNKEDVGRLFRPFVQANAGIAARYGGSGLGLALCRQLCEGLKGHIEVQSTTGVGSRFQVVVPVDIPPADTVDGTNAPQAASLLLTS